MVTQVKNYRRRAGVKQEGLAKATGIGRSTISEIENGELIPSVLIALKLAKYFHCRVEDLFSLSPRE